MDLLSDRKTKTVYDMGAYEMLKTLSANELEDDDPEEHQIHVPLESLYSGTEMEFDIGSKRRVCPGCSAKSKSDFCLKVCKTPCPGEMQMKVWFQNGMQYQMQEEVPSKLKCRRDKKKFKVGEECT